MVDRLDRLPIKDYNCLSAHTHVSETFSLWHHHSHHCNIDATNQNNRGRFVNSFHVVLMMCCCDAGVAIFVGVDNRFANPTTKNRVFRCQHSVHRFIESYQYFTSITITINVVVTINISPTKFLILLSIVWRRHTLTYIFSTASL